MKKRHFLILFVTVTVAVAIGLNSGTLYDSAMLSITGDCKYWHPTGSVDLSDPHSLEAMSLDETKCALKRRVDDLKSQNGVS